MIELRQVTLNDIEIIREWRNSDLVNNVSYNRQHITAEMQKKWFNNIDWDSQVHWIVTHNNENIGYGAIKNIDKINQRCELASLYLGNVQHVLSGLGALAEYEILKYVFENIPIRKITCEVLEFNKKVIQMHKSFGFVVDGVLREHYFINNKLESVFLLSLLREEWEIKKKKFSTIFK